MSIQLTSTRQRVKLTSSRSSVALTSSRGRVALTADRQGRPGDDGAAGAGGVLEFDWGVRVDANIGLTEDPAVDLASWEAAALGRDFWGIPSTGQTRVLLRDQIDYTKTGIYLYDADAHTFTRTSDADTTEKLHGAWVAGKLAKDHFTGLAPSGTPGYLLLAGLLYARDATDPIGTAEFDFTFAADFQTYSEGFAAVYTAVSGGGGGLAYSPANGAHWAGSDPSDMKTALDRLAAAYNTQHGAVP